MQEAGIICASCSCGGCFFGFFKLRKVKQDQEKELKYSFQVSIKQTSKDQSRWFCNFKQSTHIHASLVKWRITRQLSSNHHFSRLLSMQAYFFAFSFIHVVLKFNLSFPPKTIRWHHSVNVGTLGIFTSEIEIT